MRTSEFIEKITNTTCDIYDVLEVKPYVPIEVKRAIAQEIVYESTINENGYIKMDSFERYMSYVNHMILAHTNLEYTDDDYDILCCTPYGETSLLNAIMSCFGEDAKECSRILDMITDDTLQESTIECTVAKFINDITNRISDITDVLKSKTEGVNLKEMIPESIDMDKLGEFLQKQNK